MSSFQTFYFQMFSKVYYDKREGGSPILAMVQPRGKHGAPVSQCWHRLTPSV